MSNGCGDWSPEVIRWIYHDGVSVGLCAEHVDMWFDIADDDPDLEPAEVRWVNAATVPA